AVYTELTHVQAKAVRDVVNGVAPNSGPVFSSQIAGSAAWQIIMENPAQIQHISLLTNDGSHANASHGNTTQRNWFSNLWHKFVAVITTVAGEIYTFVLDSVAAVGDFIMSVLNKAGLLISQAIDWLSALFNWNDILQVQDQLETGFNECMQGLSDGMAAMRSSFDSFMDSSIVSIDEAIDSLISQVQPADEQATLGSTLAPAKDGAIQAQYRSVQAQWGTATLTDHVNATQSTLPPVTLSSGMDTIIDNLINRLNALINNPQYSAPFNQAKQDLMNYFKNPDAVPNILNLGIIDLLNIIKSITNLAMETLKLVIDTLFDYAQQAIALMCRLLNQPLTIPVLSPLYSSITTSSQYPQGKTLSFLSLGALLIAIPTTVTYKLIHGVHAFENGARTARTENPYLNLLVYPIVGAYSRLLIGVTDAWLDRQSLIPQPAAVPDTALELVASLLNWFGTGIAQWMDQKFSGRSMMELLTISSTGLNEDNPEEVARFFESLCWDYRWAYVAADAICFGVELGRSSVKRYRLMRNTNDPVTGFPIGAVIHTLMACPMLAFQVGKLTQDIIVVNSRTYENAEHKRELLAAASLNGAGNILDTFTDFAEAPYRMINIDLRETSVVQPETAPAMEAANIALNVAIVGIDIGVRVLAGVIAAITPSLVALGTEPEPE
ncbi:MAG: hypothetical protein JNM52_04580, partial [Betaproteobacteria bacterium]|nr:hypothetical protein [Betaproteobacteria bacterium]